MNPHHRVMVLAGVVAMLAYGALVPRRTSVRVESSPGNPVQRIILESRSALGLRRHPWGARVEGAEVWGNGREGFFLAPTTSVKVRVQAWPGFNEQIILNPISGGAALTLREQGDRDAFRAWFVGILEQQLEAPSPAWEPAQRDCAGLLRFAFREAWGPHTDAWRDRVGFPGSPAASEPSLAMGGPWRRAFPTPEGWKPFAKGAFLRRLACEPLGRDLTEARPGDLIFFARGGAHQSPDHAMAFVRPDVDGQPILLYHTGPEGAAGTGEVRRVRLDELTHHPDPEFRPLPENPCFLGVYRWKILVDSPVSGS
ncbi:MAG: hypothetical protein H6Q00_2062 [Holophagaceae bacterium]|nr:hypothetical protein [Holophagaceae bacterium]